MPLQKQITFSKALQQTTSSKTSLLQDDEKHQKNPFSHSIVPSDQYLKTTLFLEEFETYERFKQNFRQKLQGQSPSVLKIEDQHLPTLITKHKETQKNQAKGVNLSIGKNTQIKIPSLISSPSFFDQRLLNAENERSKISSNRKKYEKRDLSEQISPRSNVSYKEQLMKLRQLSPIKLIDNEDYIDVQLKWNKVVCKQKFKQTSPTHERQLHNQNQQLKRQQQYMLRKEKIQQMVENQKELRVKKLMEVELQNRRRLEEKEQEKLRDIGTNRRMRIEQLKLRQLGQSYEEPEEIQVQVQESRQHNDQSLPCIIHDEDSKYIKEHIRILRKIDDLKQQMKESRLANSQDALIEKMRRQQIQILKKLNFTNLSQDVRGKLKDEFFTILKQVERK